MGNYAFYGKIYRRKAELGEGFGSGCLNWDLWDLGIFRMSVRVGVGNPSYRKQSAPPTGQQSLAPIEDLTQGRLGKRQGLTTFLRFPSE